MPSGITKLSKSVNTAPSPTKRACASYSPCSAERGEGETRAPAKSDPSYRRSISRFGRTGSPIARTAPRKRGATLLLNALQPHTLPGGRVRNSFAHGQPTGEAQRTLGCGDRGTGRRFRPGGE